MTSDPDARALAARIAGARVVPDHDPPRGMNAAVARGLAAVADGAGRGGAGAHGRPAPGPAPTTSTAILAAGARRALGAARPLPRRDRHQRDAAAPADRRWRPASAPTRSPATRAQAARRGLAVGDWSCRACALDIDTPARPHRPDGRRRAPAPTLEVCARAGDRRACSRPGAPSEALAAVGAARGGARGRPGGDARRRARGAEGVVPGDVVMVAQKVVSKAEGRIVSLAEVVAGPGRARARRGDRQGARAVRADPLREPRGSCASAARP